MFCIPEFQDEHVLKGKIKIVLQRILDVVRDK